MSAELKKAIQEVVFLLNDLSIFFDMTLYEWGSFPANFTITVAVFSGSDTRHEMAEQSDWQSTFYAGR